MRIKEAAQEIGVSKRVLILLEEEGLIQPLRSRGGHRYFTPEVIAAARAAFFPPNPKIQTPGAKPEAMSV